MKKDAGTFRVVVIGGGSAGCLATLGLRACLAAAVFRTRYRRLELVQIKSTDIPIIGVGESTTPALPIFLHRFLGLPPGDLLEAVKPTWKLGIRFLWGPRPEGFLYTFDYQFDHKLPGLLRETGFYAQRSGMEHASLKAALGTRGRSPFLKDPRTGQIRFHGGNGYHIENKPFVDYLEGCIAKSGVRVIDRRIEGFTRLPDGDVEAAVLEGGERVAGDLFVDASGFASILLGRVLEVPFLSYADALLCDRAVVGGWERDEPIRPVTGAETMDAGWLFRIELQDRINTGYVFSSRFLSEDQARAEFLAYTRGRPGGARLVTYRTGRRERLWERNVVGIGNSGGFVEPLEATALHMVCDQVSALIEILLASDLAPTPTQVRHYNAYLGARWDEIRDFLAVHYRFNRRRDTAFWRHCRAETPLGSAQALTDFYAENGPSTLGRISLVAPHSLFGLEGYLAMLLGMEVETAARPELLPQEESTWRRYVARNVEVAESALDVEDALALVSSPDWSWKGIRVDRFAPCEDV